MRRVRRAPRVRKRRVRREPRLVRLRVVALDQRDLLGGLPA